MLTAVANDYGVERMFARQVEALGDAGDALIAISKSGASANGLSAVEEARARGLAVVALTGGFGGKLAPMADVAIRIPSDVTAHVQDPPRRGAAARPPDRTGALPLGATRSRARGNHPFGYHAEAGDRRFLPYEGVHRG